MAGAGVVAGLGIAKTGLLPGVPASVTASAPTPAASPSPSSTSTASSPVIRSFVSTALTAPHVASWSAGPTGAGLLFVGPMGHGANG